MIFASSLKNRYMLGFDALFYILGWKFDIFGGDVNAAVPLGDLSM
jgi:hypothetical protein